MKYDTYAEALLAHGQMKSLLDSGRIQVMNIAVVLSWNEEKVWSSLGIVTEDVLSSDKPMPAIELTSPPYVLCHIQSRDGLHTVSRNPITEIIGDFPQVSGKSRYWEYPEK